MTELREDRLYIQYAKGVVNREILANKYIILACQRFLDWFSYSDRYFDYDDVDRKIRFISKLKHFTGEFDKKPFILLDFQQWIMASIFGWKWTETGYRVTKTSLLMIARKNGKTSITAAIALAHLLCDNEANAQVACLANSTKQASIMFDMISKYCSSVDPEQQIFQRYRHAIKVPLTNSRVDVFSADSSKLDGGNFSLACIDEMGMAKTWDLYNVMKSSMGMRKQPLMCVISTANFLVGDYPLYEMWENCKEILTGNKHDDSQFAAIYQLDEGDDWHDSTLWPKASPTLGKVVEWDFMNQEYDIAVNTPTFEVNFLTKLLNQFCQSAVTWIPNSDILAHTKTVDLESFNKDNPDEYYCYCGVDLSVVSDLTAVAYMVEKDEICYFKVDYYLPLGSIDKSSNKDLYRKWVRDGYLKTTNSKTINYDEIVNDMMKVNEKLPIIQVLYDRYNARSWAQTCEEYGLVMTPFAQTLGAFNTPTKEFERMLYQGNIILDNNPITRFCFSNVELKYDDKENCKPIKSNGANGKIDGVIALLECLGGWLNNAKFTANIELV